MRSGILERTKEQQCFRVTTGGRMRVSKDGGQEWGTSACGKGSNEYRVKVGVKF